ncbi:MAG: hypothetical protein HY319_23510 [Armatimonadetes bacterium]|nr:hypothetical protein [Armatimonadota bacterium]
MSMQQIGFRLHQLVFKANESPDTAHPWAGPSNGSASAIGRDTVRIASLQVALQQQTAKSLRSAWLSVGKASARDTGERTAALARTGAENDGVPQGQLKGVREMKPGERLTVPGSGHTIEVEGNGNMTSTLRVPNGGGGNETAEDQCCGCRDRNFNGSLDPLGDTVEGGLAATLSAIFEQNVPDNFEGIHPGRETDGVGEDEKARRTGRSGQKSSQRVIRFEDGAVIAPDGDRIVSDKPGILIIRLDGTQVAAGRNSADSKEFIRHAAASKDDKIPVHPPGATNVYREMPDGSLKHVGVV